METYGIDFSTSPFVIYISKHNHHHEGTGTGAGTGGILDCGSCINLSPSELYDQLRLLRDMTRDTLKFMKAMCEASEFEGHFGF
jgi:hypothetical protein